VSRELLLLRHGKAERYDGSEDYDRCLKKRGKKDAKRMGEWLKEQQLLPDVVISSPAIRAIMTARIVCDALGIDRDLIQTEKRLYDEGLVRVKSVLADCKDSFIKVLVVGHNPELEDLLAYLVSLPQLPEVEKLLPTAALARLVLPDDWTHLEKDCAKLVSITSPRSLVEEFDE
jgi:phosphohistidine phosphatase